VINGTGKDGDAMRKVSIVGVSASGKSTLARTLSEELSIPTIELDALFWNPEWQASEPEVFRAKSLPLLEQSKWIVDGNYGQVRNEVWAQADTIIWIQIPFWQNLWSVFRRTMTRLFSREKLWGTNRESFWKQFTKDSMLLWVWKTYRPYENRYSTAFKDFALRPESPRLVALKSREQIRIFTDSVRRNENHDFCEKVLVYPLRFQKPNEPEVLVYRNAKTGLIEVMAETRDTGTSVADLARRELSLDGWQLDLGHPRRFAMASRFVKIDIQPTIDISVDEKTGRKSAVTKLRAIGANARQRTRFELHHAYWARIHGAPDRLTVRLNSDELGKVQEYNLFWMSLDKAEKTMSRNSKVFLKDLKTDLEAYQSAGREHAVTRSSHAPPASSKTSQAVVSQSQAEL